MPDIDCFIFLYLVGVTIFGSLRSLRKNIRSVPQQFEFEEVSTYSLTAPQKDFLDAYDAKLASLNYSPICTYRIKNYGQNLLRSYICPGDKARCVLMVVELTTKVGDVVSATHNCVIEFITRFPNDRSLTTRNMTLKSLMDQPPGRMVQECPTVQDPAVLKQRHDALASTMGEGEWPAADARSIFTEVQRSHDRFSRYQMFRGLYSWDEATKAYTVTDKIHWRGIRNHFNPFVQRVSLSRLVAALVVGTVFPVAAVLLFAPRAANFVGERGFSFLPVSEITTLAFYIAAGAFIGHILGKGVLWAFILTYLGVHLASGWTSGFIPYSTIAGLAAYYMAQLNARRKLILIPQRARLA